MSNTGLIPNRTLSAPLGGKGAYTPPAHRDPNRQPAVRPPGFLDRTGTTPQPEAGAPERTTPQPASGEPSRGITPSPPAEDLSPPPPPPPAQEQEEDDDQTDEPESDLLADRVYSTTFMRMMKQEVGGDDVTDAFRKFGAELWDSLPAEQRQERPDNAWSREGLFRNDVKRPKERTLVNQVLGILTRLTPDNYSVLERELLALPIKQSTKDQIEAVVKTIYLKAINPPDAPYVPLYMQLVVALVNNTGSSGVGKTICRAIVENCQQQFEGSKFILKPEDMFRADGSECDDEEIESKKKMLKDKLKANITFLGHLFLHHLVQEKVVNLVLYQLMYGDQSRPKKGRHKPEDYEVEMFCSLFCTVGAKLTAKTLEGSHWPTYIDSMRTLQNTTTSNRIKFMLADALEFYNNGWVTKRAAKATPMTLEEQARKDVEDKLKQSADLDRAIREKSMAKVPARPTGAASPKLPTAEPVRLPAKNEILEPMEELVKGPKTNKDAAFQRVADFLKKLPTAENRRDYFGWWVERSITQIKCSDEREMLGEILQKLIELKVFSADEASDLIDHRLRDLAQNGIFEDNPKLFSNWAGVVYKDKSGRFGLDAHSKFLKHLVAAQRPPPEIGAFIGTVLQDSESKFYTYAKPPVRFRLLPYLLKYVPFEEDSDEFDILWQLDSSQEQAVTKDDIVEVKVFNLLCEDGIKQVQEMVTTHPYRMELGLTMMVVCAIFTYVRFDPAHRLDRYKEFFSNQLKANSTRAADFGLALCTEVYQTWKDLDQTPERSIVQTLLWLVQNRYLQPPVIESFKAQLKMDGSIGLEVIRKMESEPSLVTRSIDRRM